MSGLLQTGQSCPVRIVRQGDTLLSPGLCAQNEIKNNYNDKEYKNNATKRKVRKHKKRNEKDEN